MTFMPRALCLFSAAAFAAFPARAQEVTSSGPAQLTIYNQQFAVVREPVNLPLKNGTTRLTFTGATAHLEADSVILRDLSGKRSLTILEQNYEADPISADLLLSQYEGKSLDFAIALPGGSERIVSGKIIRAPYVIHQSALSRYNSQYYGGQAGFAYGSGNQPIVEIEGKLRFGLPGTPLFPALGDANLKPTLSWSLASDAASTVKAELAYVSGGMTWESAYSLVLPEDSARADFTGLVTIDNQSGKSFGDAHIQLMAGDISKLQQNNGAYGVRAERAVFSFDADNRVAVAERSLDEYHLYTLARATTLKDRETKQVEFVRAEGIETKSTFVYDGAAINWNQYSGWSEDNFRNDRSFGSSSNSKVAIMREFKNTTENHLGIALPAGKVRFYRRDKESGALQFVGENRIDHTPQGEMVRVYTGNAFDIVGERKQTNYNYQSNERFVDESFEITLRNRKKIAATVQVVEHLYRGATWDISATSQPFVKKDSRTIEYTVPLAPNEEKKIIYTVRYRW